MKYTNKKKLVAVMALLIVAASFGGCNSANTTATIDPEVTSSEIVSSAPVSSAETSSEETSSEAVSSAPVSSEVEKPESEAASSEATTSSAAEVSSKAEAPATSSESSVSSAPAAVSQPVVSSAQAVTSEPAVSTPATTSQPVSSAATSAPSTKTVSAPTQPSGSTKAFEDMTIEEQDQWLLDQLNQQLGNIEAHEYGTDGGTGGNSAESSQPAEGTGDVYEAIRLVNEERVKAGLNELEIDDTLMEIASIRATELIQSPSHTRPDGTKYWHMFSEYDINSRGIGGECIAPSATAQKAVTEWMHSPGHRDIILTEGANRIGVGYIYDANSSLEHNWILIVCD